MKCQQCRFFQAHPRHPKSDHWFGECRKKAPVHPGETSKAEWPRVWGDEWCGEFEAIDGA